MSAAVFDSLSNLDLSSPPASAVRVTKPRVWTTFAAWFATAIVGNMLVIGYYAVLGVGVGIVVGVEGITGADLQAVVTQVFQQPLTAVMLTIVPFQLGMALVVLNAARRSKEPLRERLGLLPQSGRKVGGLMLVSAACFTVSTALAVAIGMSLLFAKPGASNVGAAINDSSWWSLTLLSLILSILPAVVEETLFRGYIQRRMLQRWSPAAAITVSTLLFALLHMDSLQHILAVIPLGVVTGLLAYRTNSILPGMLVHGVHNAVAVGFAAMIRMLTPQMTEDALGMTIVGVIAMLGLIGLPAIIALCRPRMERVAGAMLTATQMRSVVG